MFSSEFCEISKNTFIYRTPLVAASGFSTTLSFKDHLRTTAFDMRNFLYFYNNRKENFNFIPPVEAAARGVLA